MHVAELWRFPVKSLAGERLDAVDVREDGLPGDRMLRVLDATDRLVTARTKPGLLALTASMNGGGPCVEGRPWDQPEAAAAVARAAGADARLAPAGADDSFHDFDESPLLVATDGAIAALGYESRRFRPNILIAGVDGMAERGWDGFRLRIGDVVEIDLGHLCKRCAIPTFDPDSQEQDPDVLRRINADLGGVFARNCWVMVPGRIAVGDPVELV